MIDGNVDGDLKLSLAPDDEPNQRIELTVYPAEVDGLVIYSGILESESRTACGWLQFLQSDAAIAGDVKSVRIRSL